MAGDIFKLQNDSPVQSVEALGTSEKKLRKTQILSRMVINLKSRRKDTLKEYEVYGYL